MLFFCYNVCIILNSIYDRSYSIFKEGYILNCKTILIILGIYAGIALLVRLATIFTLSVQKNIKSINAQRGVDAAEALLDAHGYHFVRIERTSFITKPKYDRKTNVVNLPTHMYRNTSIVACALCAYTAASAISFIENNLLYKLNRFSKKALYVTFFLLLISAALEFFASVPHISLIAFILFTLANLVYLPALALENIIIKRTDLVLRLSKEYSPKELSRIKRILYTYSLQ